MLSREHGKGGTDHMDVVSWVFDDDVVVLLDD